MFQIVLASEFIESLKCSTHAPCTATGSSTTAAQAACSAGSHRSLGCYAHLALDVARRALGAH
jgi:hypothetical protein